MVSISTKSMAVIANEGSNNACADAPRSDDFRWLPSSQMLPRHPTQRSSSYHWCSWTVSPQLYLEKSFESNVFKQGHVKRDGELCPDWCI